ncbi:MAG TPA: hypothetical protein VGB30_11870 [bacterium]|jgi:hypothetical protein
MQHNREYNTRLGIIALIFMPILLMVIMWGVTPQIEPPAHQVAESVRGKSLDEIEVIYVLDGGGNEALGYEWDKTLLIEGPTRLSTPITLVVKLGQVDKIDAGECRGYRDSE